MASLAKVTINWTGFQGGPGYTNLYFRNSTPGIITQAVVNNAITKVDTWLDTWMGNLPPPVSVGVNATVEEIDDANGNLVAFWQGTPAAAASGSDTGVYSAASGVCVNWYTNTVRNSRRIRGRTFVVPLGGTQYDTNGTIGTSRLDAWRPAAAALHAATGDARLVIWGRPNNVAGDNGVSAEVTSSTINDKVAILTSRRD